MRTLPLFRRVMTDSFRSTAGWSLGVAGALFLYLPLYPSFGSNPEFQALIDSLPRQMVDALGYDNIATGAGYTQSTFFGLIGFLLLTVAGVAWGTAAIAGDEESGGLELTIAHGVSRRQLVLERFLALTVRLLWLCLFAALIVLTLNEPAGLGIELVNLAATASALLGVTMLFGSVSLVVGAFTGRRSYALGAGAGVAVASYAINAVANQSTDLNWLHGASPYHWAFGGSPLLNGADWGGLALLFGVTAVFLLVSVFAFQRRDVS